MSIDSSSQLSLLAHLRHELRTPINAIIGYSEMLLEELETEDEQYSSSSQKKDCKIACELQNIQNCGSQLLFLVNTILSPTQQEDSQLNLDLSILRETLRVKLQTPAKTVTNCCQQLLNRVPTELISDLDRIQIAAESLLRAIDNSVELSEHFLFRGDIEQTPSLITAFAHSDSSQNLTTAPVSSDKNTILVVDDKETNRDLLSRQIEAQGYQVAVAANGQQALQMIQTGQYDLILLDIIMPEMNGYEVLKWLRNSLWRHIPVITISALDEIDSVVKCIEMGAEDYLSKPFNSVLLRARIGACLEKKRLRDQESLYLDRLALANQEITSLNERLQAENVRLNAELDVTRRLQQMMLPKEKELMEIDGLEIAGFMQPANEVGGDYYDILEHNGLVKIGIGDVTGHGLESGVLMIMVQTAVRTLIENNETDPKKFLDVLNRTIYKNVQRMNSDKNLTLCLMDYQKGKLSLSGQHEEIIVVRSGGEIERIDTIDLGFPLGLEETIADFVFQIQIQLHSGDVVVLYTDGITEAENELGVQYGLERLCEMVRHNWQRSAREVRQLVIEDLQRHINEHRVYDDITLVVLKQK
ncbi:SpoIIE family protein phosphatase [Pleurocapsales cyanobacterium LEGE 06147]|nr:SpoIIE family protein phosphatase [Pleurocapsales cyanobacterium LEGE 06147]